MRLFRREKIYFTDTLRRIDRWAGQARTEWGAEGEQEMLDFFIDMITDDIRTSVASNLIYCHRMSWPDAGFPFIGLPKQTAKRTVSSEGMTVIATPWNPDRLTSAVHHVKHSGFRSDMSPVRNGAWYPELRLIVVDSGQHHSCVAAQWRLPGLYEVDVYPLSDYFSDVSTDGIWWYDKRNKMRTYPVLDVRIAILYEIARRRRELK